MNLIEPTYLRYVHDSLDKGSLNAENAAALPYGFIGLYEDAFQSNIPISKRQSTLKRLAIWALFKGGVSAYLASQILNESQEDTKSLINSFSSWFNTTDSNKYILYHDRLRTYLLQKLSSNEIQELNEQIISYLEKAIETQKEDEAEIYALEHLSTHIAIESQMDSNYQRLHDFASHLLNHVSLIECVKFLDDIKGKWDSESFVEKNQGQLSKYLEDKPSKYYLLSRFNSNSKLKNFLINNHFKTKFKKNQDLSVFEKVIKTEPFQELIDLHK